MLVIGVGDWTGCHHDFQDPQRLHKGGLFMWRFGSGGNFDLKCPSSFKKLSEDFG